MINLNAAMQSLITGRKTFRFARCWKIVREDAVEFYYTEHNEPIVLIDENTYKPAGGMESSVVQKQTKLQTENLEFVGMISSADVTEDDLRGGRFREATVTVFLVDWMYPWVGSFSESKYWISEISFTGERWEAKVEGLGRFLKPKVGDLYSRTCRHELGDASCQVDISVGGGNAVNDTLATVSAQRQEFTGTGLGGFADFFFDYGKIIWTTGNNAGLIHEIKDFRNSTQAVTLQIPAPYDFQVGDTYSIHAGCEKRVDDCKTKFSNFDFFGGFPFIPGTNNMMTSPGY